MELGTTETAEVLGNGGTAGTRGEKHGGKVNHCIRKI